MEKKRTQEQERIYEKIWEETITSTCDSIMSNLLYITSIYKSKVIENYAWSYKGIMMKFMVLETP